MTDTENPNLLPLELLPEGWAFKNLSKYGMDNYRCDIAEKDKFGFVHYGDGRGPTPRAAMLAAIEKIKGEG